MLIFLTRTHELFTSLIGSIVTIFSFVAILWFLSAATPLPLFGRDLSFPGWLIVVAASYAAIGTLFSHLIGRPLIKLNFNQQRYEADFRFAIARATDQSEPIALMGGEAVERRELRHRFAQPGAQLDAACQPSKLSGRLHRRLCAHVDGVSDAGGDAGLSLRRDHARRAGADRAGVPAGRGRARLLHQRLQQDRRMEGGDGPPRAVRGGDAHGRRPSEPRRQDRLAMLPGDGRLQVDDLVLRLPSGEAMASFDKLELAPGERLLVGGASGAGKSSFFRALSGLWPLGEGTIHFPENAKVFTLPQRSYFPLGSLRQAIAYPTLVEKADDEAIRDALRAVGLPHLTERLDEEADWPTVLAGGEQQRAAFARALLAKPDILLLDEPVSALEEADAEGLYRLLAERLPRAIVITIGRAALLGHLHGAAIHLERGVPASTTTPLAPTRQIAARRADQSHTNVLARRE